MSTTGDTRLPSAASHLTRDEAGVLLIEGVRATDLAATYGTPLHVVSEQRLRENFRRIRSAFSGRWSAGVNVNYATKANPALAIRRVMTEEGAGGDCLGLHELQAALLVGTPGPTIVVNGFNKPDDIIEAAIRCGARINIDDENEPARIDEIARRIDLTAQVGIRMKPDMSVLAERPSDIVDLSVGQFVAASKWGLETDVAATVIAELQQSAATELVGLHCHLGRHLAEPEMFRAFAAASAAMVSELARQTGWAPKILSLGGGFTQGRDPFYRYPGAGGKWPRQDDDFVAPIEEYADALCESLEQGLRDLPGGLPVLELEPGRYIASDAVLTLTRVGTVKHGSERSYVGVDATGAQLGLSRSPRDAHAVIVADSSEYKSERICDVVGPLCVLDVIMENDLLPSVERGALLAILDTGAYADGEASNANSIGRPAGVLVAEGAEELIRRRETFGDIFGRDSVPIHLF